MSIDAVGGLCIVYVCVQPNVREYRHATVFVLCVQSKYVTKGNQYFQGSNLDVGSLLCHN
jgi:hypothetical protein